jgi:signal transduction histidine kinase
MKIRIKTMIVLIITTLCLIASLHFISENIILSNFKQLEQNQVSGVIGQVQVALVDELDRYQAKVNNWAKMENVTYFVKQQEKAFDGSNDAVTGWVDLGINYLLIYNTQGKYMTGFGFNLTSYHQEQVPQSLTTEISNNPVIWSLTTLDSTTHGILNIPTGALIIASSLIHSESSDKLIGGTLIMARYLDQEEVSALSRTVQLPITVTAYSQLPDSQKVKAITQASFSQPASSNSIIGYYVAKDLRDHPALLIGVTIPRSIYVQGVITVNYIDILLTVSCVVFSITVALLLELSYLTKLSKLTHQVSELSTQTSTSKRLPTKGNDEIENLTRSINGMLDKIEDNTDKLQKAERFSAIGELATMVAHDLRNPLQGIAVAAYYLKRKVNPQSTDAKMIEQIDEDVRYSDKIINDLLDYSREIRLDVISASPRCLLWKALSIACVPEKVKLVDETTDEPTVRVDVDSMLRVFINIINNAVDAMPNGGTLTIRCSAEADMARFQFADTGEGIKEENRRKLFQPLFTTKAKGMGFGLSICKRIVDAHGGKIVVESKVRKGTTFNIYLPLAEKKRGNNLYAQ